MRFEHGNKTIVQTGYGKVRGFKKNQVCCFFGIPYARAQRFMPPEPPENWEGVKEATSYGYSCCLLDKEEIGDDLSCPHRFWPQSEDCLNLNIWTRGIDKKKRPVVVWLHGGGFFAGSSVEQVAYDGFNMASYGDAVVVSVNHRLNLLGYLDLRKYGERYARSVNAGNLDLVAALRWIKDNIGEFGGDKDNVTLFGQSGGGGKIISLMNMPSAAGLFHKAMIMSGTLGDFLTDQDVDTSAVIDRFLKILGIDPADVQCLETLPYDVLAKAYCEANCSLGNKGIPYFAPQRNEDYLGDPMDVGFSDFAAKIPVVIGSTFSEFNVADGDLSRNASGRKMRTEAEKRSSRNAVELFEKSFPDDLLIDVLTYDSGAFRSETKKWVRQRVREGCAPTYMYLFKPELKLNGGCMPYHCSDIPFVFHNTDLVCSAYIGRKTRALEKEIFYRFMSFAGTGNVNDETYKGWLANEQNHEYTYVFDKRCCLKEDLDDDLISELEKIRKPFAISELIG